MKSLKVGIAGAGGMIGKYLAENWGNENLFLYSTQEIKIKYQHFLRSVDPKQDQLTAFVQSSDVIIHLGHNSNAIESNQLFPVNFGHNISFTQRLILELVQHKKSQRPLLVYLSSGGTVYGNVNPILGGINESQATLPISPYGLEKLTCEHLLRLGAIRGHYKLVILRASNVYGSFLEVNKNQGIIGVWLSRIKAGLPLKITMDPQTIRDYLHIHDLTIAINQIINAQLPNDYYCFNIGTGKGHSIVDIIELLEKTSQSEIILESSLIEQAKYAPKWNVLNCEKINHLIGWRSTISLEMGIANLWSSLFLKGLGNSP